MTAATTPTWTGMDAEHVVCAVRAPSYSGDVACAVCDDSATWRVMLGGQSWYTSCRDHLAYLINGALTTAGCRPMTVAEVRRKYLPRQLDSTP